MTEPTLELIGEVSPEPLHGNIVARGVSAEDYMETYAEHFYEWVDGVVYKMSPANIKHQLLSQFLSDLIRFYLQKSMGGMVINPPFVMRLDEIKSRREPDLIVVLQENLYRFNDTYLDGPADICIEIVSPSNESVDRVTKKDEYERGGVKEFWLFDPRHYETTFYRRDEQAGKFVQVQPHNGIYTTPLLPNFQLDTALLWQVPLPDIEDILEQVKAMLG